MSCSVVVTGWNCALDDEAGDLRGVGLVAEFERASASSGSERRLSRAEAGWPRVGSMHVERTRAAVGESAGGVVDLRAGHANVRDYRVSALDAGLGEDGREGGEVGLKEVEVAADGFEFARAAVRFEGQSRCR